MRKPLAGKRILLTRPHGENEALVMAVRSLGGEPIVVPAIEILPLPLKARDRSWLEKAGYFDWVAFTSVNALKYLFVCLEGVGRDLSESIRVAAVGPTTAAACRERGLHVVAQPPISTGAALGELLAERFAPGKLLLPKSNRGRRGLAEILGRAGWKVVPVACYETRYAAIGVENAGAIEKGVDAALFASPSAVSGLLEGLPGPAGRSFKEALCVPIGPSTEGALMEAGLRTAAPPVHATKEGLVNALLKALEENHGG